MFTQTFSGGKALNLVKKNPFDFQPSSHYAVSTVHYTQLWLNVLLLQPFTVFCRQVVGVRAELERHLVSSEQQLAVAEAELSAQRDELLRRLSEEAEQTRTEAERRRRGWEAELARGVAEREAAVKVGRRRSLECTSAEPSH